MIASLLQTALNPVAERHRSLRRWRGLALCWMAILIAARVIVVAKLEIPFAPLILGLIAAIISWLVWRRAAAWKPNYHSIARTIEERQPDLHALLVTAVEQRPRRSGGELSFLQQRVVTEAIRASRERPWVDAIPQWVLGAAVIANALLFLAMIVALHDLPLSRNADVAAMVPGGKAVSVTPGDTELERGNGFVVLAKFASNPPPEATLVVTRANQAPERVPLAKNLDDPVFGGGLPNVDADLSYHVEYASEATREFHVHVFEHPRLERADAVLHFPNYTQLPEKKIADTRRVSAVEGTKLSFTMQLNKPVKAAQLVAKNQPPIALTVEAGKAVVSLRELPIAASATYELKLVDADGRSNKVPDQFTIEALPNRRPELKFIQPKGDQRVSALQEISFVAEAWDDFGMPRFGMSYTVADSESKEVVFTQDTKPDERVQGRQMVKLEEVGVKPDDLISWTLWAEDIGPDGAVRRTSSDLYFAEVRPFEEVYRPGQEGGGEGEAGSGEETSKLAELQKQIIAATWNLQRGESTQGGHVSPKYATDEPVIRDSQKHVVEMAEAMREKIDQPRARAFLETAIDAMQEAGKRLGEAANSTEPLPAALTAEQSAYSALLKLASHEFQVSKSKSNGKPSSSQNRQQELEQLDLKAEEKRYETRKEAAPQQNAQQTAQLAILNRLKELAQRQQDINERLKELQTALQEAKDEAQKEEIRRRLKRLREEEQQLVSEADATQQKMQQPENAAALAQERKQLEQTRDQAQRAAEAMERGAVPEALASGTRTGRELQQLRDDFRKKSAGQFSDEMREMRTDARELAARQEAISKQLAEDAQKTARRTLDGSGAQQLAKDFESQQEKLGQLREAMKRVSEQAEAVEPLLSKELYDTLRKNAQQGTDETLKRAGQLATNGFGEHARKFESKAREEIEEVKSGVERAAESVLGNEAEALRTARAEIDALSEQLNREIAKAEPKLAQNDAAAAGGAGANTQDSAEAFKKTSSGDQAGKPVAAQGKDSAEPKEGGGPGLKPREDSAQSAETPNGSGKGESTAQAQSENGSGTEGGEKRGSGKTGDGKGEGKPQGGEGASSKGQNGKGSAPGGEAGDPQRPGEGLRQLTSNNRVGSGNGGAGGTEYGPLAGGGFVEWSDRLRNVEEMLDQPALRNEAAQVREAARGIRAESKKNAAQPAWDEVRSKISLPLAELRNRVSEELARRDSKESLVPIDRDPVPARFAEQVRKYYEDLGRSAPR